MPAAGNVKHICSMMLLASADTMYLFIWLFSLWLTNDTTIMLTTIIVMLIVFICQTMIDVIFEAVYPCGDKIDRRDFRQIQSFRFRLISFLALKSLILQNWRRKFLGFSDTGWFTCA